MSTKQTNTYHLNSLNIKKIMTYDVGNPGPELQFPHQNDVFTSSCKKLWEGSYLLYVICVCLRIMVSNTYRVVFLFCFSSSCVPCVASFSELSIFDCPFGIL